MQNSPAVPATNPSHTVGIAASDAGLSAVEPFFDTMSPDAGIVRQSTSENLQDVFRELRARNDELAASNAELLQMNELLEQKVEKHAGELKQEVLEHSRTEASLRKLSRAVEQSPTTIVITDTLGTIEFVNPKFTELTGYTAAEAIGQNPRVLKSGQTSVDTYRELWSTISSGETWEGEFLNKGKSGKLFWERETISALRDESGVITHYLAVKEDITEKKSILKQLVTAKEQAEAANRAKSEFLANMSHEIRTPMNGIMGMSQLMDYTELSAEQKEYLDAIRTSSENLLYLINDILDLSKIEAGKIELEDRNFSLRRTINDILKIQMVSVHAKNLHFSTEIPDEIPDSLNGDPLRLKQILLNIVGNAIKFTDIGCISVAVTLDGRIDDILNLKVSVTDTGIGIDPESLDQIFAPFGQEDSSTTRKFGGTGLGLSISKNLVELMGGRIWAESRKGVGSTFAVVIPLRESIHAEDSARVKHQPLWSGKVLHVLVAEDKSINRAITTKLLSRCGHTLETAEDGSEALEKWKGGHFDLILMDVEMPGMDGIEATRCIREAEKNGSHHTTIIALTAHALKNDRQRMLNIGFDGYVSKPMSMNKLMEEIKLCLMIPDDTIRLASVAPAHTLPCIDTEKLFEILRDIEALLQQNNMSVLDRVGELSAYLPAHELLGRLKIQIKQFDCTSALLTVAKICEIYAPLTEVRR